MLAIALLVGGYLYLRLDDEVRRYAENLLADHYSELDVKLGSAHFETGRGVVLRDLVISDRDRFGHTIAIAEVPEMQLLGPFDTESLLAGQSRVERIRIRSARIEAVRATDGQWNLSRLFPPPSMGGKPADIELVGAIVTLTDNCNGECSPVTLREVSLGCRCMEYSPDDPTQRTFRITGSVGGELAESFTFDSTADTGAGIVEGSIKIDGLDLGSTAANSLRQHVPQLARVSEVSGKANLNISGRVEPNQPPTWNVDYQLIGARVVLAGVPRPVTNITGQGTASNTQLRIVQASANLGEASLSLAVDRRGWSPNAQMAFRARAEQLTIDSNFEKLLPDSALEAWHRFEPRGLVSAEIAGQFDGKQWIPNVTVDCQKVSFIDREKFNYRLTEGKGKLVVTDKNDGSGPAMEIQNLTALLDLKPVTLNGRFTGFACPGQCAPSDDAPKPLGWLAVSAKRIPITDSLVDAIDPAEHKVRRIVDSLGVEGHISIDWKYERDQPIGEPHTTTDLTFHDARVRFEKFRYPLDHIEGTAHESDGDWSFTNLVSKQPDTPMVVQASGTCSKQPDGLYVLQLRFEGEQLPLDDTLLHSLPPAHQDAWRAVNPLSGRVNFVARIAHRLQTDSAPNIYLEIQPIDNLVFIEPQAFPYRLEKLQGSFVVINNTVTFNGLRGQHGQTMFETDGSWVPNDKGGWQLEFRNLNVDRLSANYELKEAAASSIGKVMDYLKPSGTFSIHNGILRFSRESAGSTQVTSDWKVSLGLQQNNLELGLPLRSVTGIVHLAGHHEGSLRFTTGRLELDSVFWNNMQFTQVRGPLYVDAYECWLGRGAEERINQLTGRTSQLQRIEANLYGGKLAFDSHVPMETGKFYTFNFDLDDCDLQRLSTDYLGGSVELSGTMSGQATLQGMGRSLDLLRGGGRVTVRDAQLYELPVMARMLKVLRNRVPDKTAFNGIDAQFKIDGQLIRFSELSLLGDALSLYGQGTTTFDRQLDLKFYSTVGRNDFNIPLLRSMIGQASANLLLIKVTGPAENAQVERAPLPAVNELMEQLGGENVATPPTQRGFWTR
ncbi:hypothetical protein Pan181_14100 [Aeoliella mucimassa]|uniref:Uncharacterized protein n=2 Tax=Aeoliella mucimassa TaxID=2527972 RepID=A0A518AKM0_9BACT|nr:hypothetical protein Pan181_14100 [Aeoliella mucimassa]